MGSRMAQDGLKDHPRILCVTEVQDGLKDHPGISWRMRRE